MRVDGQRNYSHLLEVARDVMIEQGAEASLRAVARRAGVGLGTLYRHFPTREALLEALLRHRFDSLEEYAHNLQSAVDAREALERWLREFATGAATYRGLSSTMMTYLADPVSPLHKSFTAMREAGGRLLARAQREGRVRAGIDGTDLFALVGAVAWITDQSAEMASRKEHLLMLVMHALEPAGALRNPLRNA